MYRAWDSLNNEMRYSRLHDGEFYINTKGVLYMYKIPNSEEYYKTYEVDKRIAVYGDLRIYEGDIVKYKYYDDFVYVVKYIKESHQYYAVGITKNQRENNLGYKINPRLKVVGNIHQNPELLKEKNTDKMFRDEHEVFNMSNIRKIQSRMEDLQDLAINSSNHGKFKKHNKNWHRG